MISSFQLCDKVIGFLGVSASQGGLNRCAVGRTTSLENHLT